MSQDQGQETSERKFLMECLVRLVESHGGTMEELDITESTPIDRLAALRTVLLIALISKGSQVLKYTT